jgi:hypothetical protein
MKILQLHWSGPGNDNNNDNNDNDDNNNVIGVDAPIPGDRQVRPALP